MKSRLHEFVNSPSPMTFEAFIHCFTRNCADWAITITTVCGLIVFTSLTFSEAADADHERAAHLARTKQMAETFQAHASRDGALVPVALNDKPLLKYSDSTRQQRESALWLWTERELPCGLMAIEFYPDNPKGRNWLFEFVSLSDVKPTVTRGKDWKWEAKQPGLQRQPISNAPEPAVKPGLRLTQSKQFFRRFTAHEISAVNGRIELRPMPNPLYRYGDEVTGVLDGAVFAFVNGTNPEVLLIIEARRQSDASEATWCYSLAQMTGAEVSASLDDREVWTQTEADPPAIRNSYVNGWLPDPDDEKQEIK